MDEANEHSKLAAASKETGTGEAWSEWVDDWLVQHHCNTASTLSGAKIAWSNWRLYLDEKAIKVPRALTHRHVVDYVAWRVAKRKESGGPGGPQISKNTAIHEVGVCGSVMREAVLRGFATVNPCHGNRIKDAPSRQKPEITEAEEKKIRESLPAYVAADPGARGYMPVAFEIAMHQGCRLHETEIPLDRTDFDRGTVTLHTKGGKRSAVSDTGPLKPIARALRIRLSVSEAAGDPGNRGGVAGSRWDIPLTHLTGESHLTK